MSTEYKKYRRKKLMALDPHCHWCRRELVMYPDGFGKKMPDDFPTLDHLTSRFFGKRKDVGMREKTMVLACPKCNVDRQKQEHSKHIWRTRWKSASFPQYLKWLNFILKKIRGHKRT